MSITVVHAETLTEQLRREAPERLVDEARKNGNIVRGAILFHQGNINCAKCHQPAMEEDRLAPDLGRLGEDVTDESLVTSILEPSKVISKGYETWQVLTFDGRVIRGLVVQEDATEMVLRDFQNIDIVHRLPRAEIEVTRPDSVSTMPSGLCNELKGRKQFLDLLRYVIDLKERGPDNTHLPNDFARKRDLASEEGLVLQVHAEPPALRSQHGDAILLAQRRRHPQRHPRLAAGTD
ncbi:MAG: hypothetical protein AAGD07_09455 [Planctomycetota bacterium]